MGSSAATMIYIVPMILIIAIYLFRQHKHHQSSISVKQAASSSGLTEPASLHPLIDPQRCIGCGSCVDACPEKQVLGLINNKAELIAPANCIGHGACKLACPEAAITLVFGTEQRGVDIPELSKDFQTSVEGVYIAGELGGMGLIRNAIEQGRQAIESIKKQGLKAAADDNDVLDVLIVGAGPAGISASLCALENKMTFCTIEQDSLGGTVSHYPRGKLVMTTPAKLPLVGKMKFSEVSKEKLIEFWQSVEHQYPLAIHYQERLEDISKQGELLDIQTNKGCYRARSVLLAIGRRGTPRKLGVPGEDLEKVVYRMIDPEQYREKHVLVVGGGDSALEAAHEIAKQTGGHVVLSYRGASFSRAKEKNRQKIEAAEHSGTLTVHLESNVKNIAENQVVIETTTGFETIKNDAVIVCAGGVLPTPMLKKIGIDIVTKYGEV